MSDKFSQHELMENMMKHSQQLLDSLIDIKVNGPMIKSHGICDNLLEDDYLHGNVEMWSADLEQLMTKWHKFSGDECFPVPSTDSSLEAWRKYLQTHNKWIGKYGQLRYELLDFLIKELTEAVEEYDNDR